MFNASWLKKIAFERNKTLRGLAFMELNIEILNLQGLWRIQENSSAQRYDFHYLYPRCLLITAILDCFMTQVIDILIIHDNVENVCENLVLLVSYGVFIASVSTSLINADGFKELLTRMKEMNNPARLNEKESRDAKTSQKLCNIFLVLALLGGTLVYLTYVVSFHIASHYDMVPRDLIYFRGWHIYDSGKSPARELSMIYRTIMLWLGLIGLVSSDAFLFTLLVHILRQFQFLRRRLKKLRLDAEEKVVKFKLSETKQLGRRRDYKLKIIRGGSLHERKCHTLGNEDKRVFIEMGEILCKCVSHHNEMIRFVKSYMNLYHARLSYQVFGNLVGTCVCCMYIILTPGLGVRKMIILVMILSGTIWFLAFGYLASKVIDESSRLCDALYSCDWYDAPESLKRSMRIMMTASTRPVAFVVMGFVPLSVETFARVTKTAYSYLKILADVAK